MARPDGGSAAHAASGRAAEAASIRDLPNARDLGPGERTSAADFDGGSAGSGGAGSGAVPGAPLEPGRGPVAYGICSVAVVPAALTLRTVWVIRDLFVVRAARHRGHARALLAHVAREARTAGAHRLSLQTETANVRAIELYAKNGFDVLTDVAIMDRLL
jgi:GNAT superfamily N-acetyltransferase